MTGIVSNPKVGGASGPMGRAKTSPRVAWDFLPENTMDRAKKY